MGKRTIDARRRDVMMGWMNIDMIQNVLDAAVAAGDVAGVAAAVIGPEGIRLEACAGVTALGGDQPVTRDTIFWIASMTKPITSVAAMQLVSQGKMSLDMEMGELLPELRHPQILENGKLRPAVKKITLKHLLTHTAGFSYPFLSQALAEFISAQDPASLPKPGTRAALNAPLLFEPGERWEYGLSTDWLGLAVEKVSGLTLDTYFLENISGPLGMLDTTFTPSAEQRARQVTLHERGADGKLVPRRLAKPFAEHFCSGGGGLFSTLADYQKFLRIFTANGAEIISAGALSAMSSNQIGALRAGTMPSANPALFAGRDVNPGMESKWGLGFLIYPERGPFGRNAGSYGWSGMANTYFWVDPEINQAAVILMQNFPSGDVGALKTYSRFEKAIYAAAQ